VQSIPDRKLKKSLKSMEEKMRQASLRAAESELLLNDRGGYGFRDSCMRWTQTVLLSRQICFPGLLV
jgi:hypothetical protein